VGSRKQRFVRGSAILAGGLALALWQGGTALANVPLTQVSTDPYTNTSSFHQTELEPDTFSYGSTTVGVHQTGRFTDGGANNIGWDTTTNNGATWTHGFLPSTTVYSTPPGPWARISDPSVAYDAADDVWMIAGLAIDASVTGKAVLVSRSLDGGLTWQAPVTVSQGGAGNFYDKEWITCDNWPSSPYYGNCYVQWDDAFQGNLFKMSRSTNGGTTWTASTVPSNSVLGGQPVVQPGGRVVVPIAGSGLDSYISNNGGQSYTGPYNIANITAVGSPGMRDGTGLPSAEVDNAGVVYVAWNDCRFRTTCTADDPVFSTSTDGQNWSAVKRVPTVPTNSSVGFFLVSIGVDHTTGGATARIGVTAYFMADNNCSPSTCKIHAGFVSSTNGGTTWGAPVKILGPLDERGLANAGGYFLGDYMSTSFGSNGKAYPVLANSSGTNCQLGNITSCHENMVAPTNGLFALGGSLPAVAGPVFSAPGASILLRSSAF